MQDIQKAASKVQAHADALMTTIDQLFAALNASKQEPAQATSKPEKKQRKPRAAKGAAQSFAEEVIEEVNASAEEINGADLGKPKKRGRPKGSKNAGPRKHGELARKIQGYIEEVGVGEVITTQQVVTLTGALGPNVSRELSRLVEANVLARSGRGEFTVRSIPTA